MFVSYENKKKKEKHLCDFETSLTRINGEVAHRVVQRPKKANESLAVTLQALTLTLFYLRDTFLNSINRSIPFYYILFHSEVHS